MPQQSLTGLFLTLLGYDVAVPRGRILGVSADRAKHRPRVPNRAMRLLCPLKRCARVRATTANSPRTAVSRPLS